ncbi:MAG: hypothetical protein MUP70_03410 [Candidatus Aminicenantes bacterium]|nr:hypothetical protein [Candidatus Aminicenantes bacterium]
MKKGNLFAIGSVVLLGFLMISLPVQALDSGQTPQEKLLQEMAGEYEFEYQGQIVVFVFSAENGNLMGAPEGETQEIIDTVEGEPMKFTAYDPNGNEWKFQFKRDDEGQITLCLVTIDAMGVTDLEGHKIIK